MKRAWYSQDGFKIDVLEQLLPLHLRTILRRIVFPSLSAAVVERNRVITDNLRDIVSLRRDLEISPVSTTVVLLHAVHIAHSATVGLEISAQAAFDGLQFGGRIAVGSSCVDLKLGVIHSTIVIAAVFGVGVCVDDVCNHPDGVDNETTGIDAFLR
jgi:hypothetical protein